MKSLTTKSFKASQFIGRNQLLQCTRPLISLNFSSRALSFGLLRFSNDRPGKYQTTKPDLIRLTSPLHYKSKKSQENNKASESMKLDNEKVEFKDKMMKIALAIDFFLIFPIILYLVLRYFNEPKLEKERDELSSSNGYGTKGKERDSDDIDQPTSKSIRSYEGYMPHPDTGAMVKGYWSFTFYE